MSHMNTPPDIVRVTVPVRADVLEAFKRMAEAGNMSTGKAMGEWLFDTMDGAVAMTEMMEKARRAPREAVAELHSYALGLTDMTEGMLSHVRGMKAAQAVMAGAAGRAEAKPARPAAKASRGAKKAITPPVGNTGGKPTTKAKK